MRRYIVLLLGSFSFLLAWACNRFHAPEPSRPEPVVVDYFNQIEAQRSVVVDSCADVPTQEQVRFSQVATHSEELEAPRPRFYCRWRRVHGRWYHFTYRVEKCTSVTCPDSSRQSRRVA